MGPRRLALHRKPIAKSVAIANQTYHPHEVNFLFDPATDVCRFNDDYLNRDSRRRDHGVYTDRNVRPEADPAFEADLMNKHQNEVALRFLSRITIYFAAGGRYYWSAGDERWIYGPRGSSYSNRFDEMARFAAEGGTMAHEIGHYLHLPHTHLAGPCASDEGGRPDAGLLRAGVWAASSPFVHRAVALCRLGVIASVAAATDGDVHPWKSP